MNSLGYCLKLLIIPRMVFGLPSALINGHRFATAVYDQIIFEFVLQRL